MRLTDHLGQVTRAQPIRQRAWRAGGGLGSSGVKQISHAVQTIPGCRAGKAPPSVTGLAKAHQNDLMFDPVDLPHRADALHLDTGPVGRSGPCRRQSCQTMAGTQSAHHFTLLGDQVGMHPATDRGGYVMTDRAERYG